MKEKDLISGLIIYTLFIGLLLHSTIVKSVMIKKRHPGKQAACFYASQHVQAPLIVEPLEWPVKVVYSQGLLASPLRFFVDCFGGYITQKQADIAFCKDPKIVQKRIDHYKKIYKNMLNMDDFQVPEQGFSTFNDWFIRKLKNPSLDRPLDVHHRSIVSPADSKLLIIPDISLDTYVTIKENNFDLAAFLNDSELAKKYEHGVMMIFRLAPYDYHRYHYPIDCTVSPEIYIDGKYHSVNPRAFLCRVKPLTINKRVYELLKPVGHDRHPVIMVQVGATAVASIVNDFMDYSTEIASLRYHQQAQFCKGDQMGYFQFGGSTVVLLFAPNTIIPNVRIVQNSLNGYETAVKVRETIALWKLKPDTAFKPCTPLI